jgi:hypothetical protein
MKVRIYKSGGSTGRFISKLERFLPTAAKGTQVDEMKQLKEAIKYQLDDKNQSASSIMLQLVRGGYDYGSAKSLVDAAEEELEESYYKKKGKKDSIMDSELIPDEDELEDNSSEEDDRKKRKELSRNMQDDIAQTAQDSSDDDSDDDQEYEDMLNEGSPYDDNLATAAFGMQVDDSKIQWPGMFNDMSSFKNGGAPNKKKFINSTVKKLMKAKAGMEADPTISQMPNPYGTLDDPRGVDLTPNKSIVAAIKGTAQSFVDEENARKQAEEMYNQQFMQSPPPPMGMPTVEQGGANDWSTNLHNYGEALDHMMPNNNTTGYNTSFSGDQMAFGGTRRVRRANKAFFGSPTALPGATTDYEFGPLGGLKKGRVEYDLGKLGQALKDNPQLAGMLMPQMGMGMPRGGGLWNRWTSNNVPQFNPFGSYSSGYSSYSGSSSSSSYPQSRLKWATQTVNNAADPSKNDEAGNLKNNSDQTNKRQKYQEYINWWGEKPIEEGMSRQAPITFEEFIAPDSTGMSEYSYWANKSVPGSTSVGSVSSGNNPNKDVAVVSPVKSKYVAPKKKAEKKPEAPVNSNPIGAAVTPNLVIPKAAPAPIVPKAKTYVEDEDQGSGLGIWDYIKLGAKMINPMSTLGFAEGGFVDFERPDLNRFVYGGDEYEYGGGIKQFGPGGPNEVDPNYRDAGGRNYQDYINWQGEDAIPEGRNRQAPQSYAEWKAETEADKKPAGTTQGNTGNTTYDQSYFDNMFKNDPKFKQGFEQYMQSQGMPTNSQRQQQGKGNFQWTNNQGTPLVGTGPANRGFGSGLLNAVGLNKDFKAYYSPQGQITREMISQMMKNGTNKVTETKFKDRGNRFNPFDNKKVTEWEVNPITGQPVPAATAPQGPVNNPAANNMAPTNNVGPVNTGENTGIDQTPDDWQYNQPAMDYMNQSLSIGQGNSQNNSSSQGALTQPDGTQSATANGSGNQPNGTRYVEGMEIGRNQMLQTNTDANGNPMGVDSKGRLVSSGPQSSNNVGRNQMFQTNTDSEGNPMGVNNKGQLVSSGNTSPKPTVTVGQPVASPVQPPAPQPQPVGGGILNNVGPMNEMDNEGMAYGGYMRQGGYIPEYMAYGGYMPDYGYGGMMHYNPGGTVVGPNQDFAGVQQNNIAEDKDGNKIPDYLELGKDPAMGADENKAPTKYRLEEENAWSFDPKKAGKALNTGLEGFSGIDQKIEFAKNREKENSEFMYASDIDRQLAYKGITDQEGIDKKAGYETGRTYTGKFGGAKYAKGGSTYAKGKVYSLTMDEINEIKSRGGSVKFIK